VVLFEGSATNDIQKAIGDNIPSLRVDSMSKAVETAAQVSEAGDVVLLSPGTSSFGIFKNEFDRGDQFVSQVKKLKGVNDDK
jgi:UDP-N-acetylmuramoylalanine--D-glutamate ligase